MDSSTSVPGFLLFLFRKRSQALPSSTSSAEKGKRDQGVKEKAKYRRGVGDGEEPCGFTRRGSAFGE